MTGQAKSELIESKSEPTLRQRLESDDFKIQIAKILPRHIKPERMVRVAITALTRTPKLKDCDQASFFLAMLNLSQWGLEPDGRRAHLIPFENRKRGVMEVQLIIDYKGLVELCMRSGDVSNIHADIVCENDEFVYDRGQLQKHLIDFKNPRGNVYAAYCLVRMKDGTEKCEVMTRDDVEAIRKRSKTGSNGPWVSDWNEMAKKTVFRRVSKWLPLSAEVQDAIVSDDDQLAELPKLPQRSGIGSLEELTERLTIGFTPDATDEVESVVESVAVEPKPTPAFSADDLRAALKQCEDLTSVTAVEKTFFPLAKTDGDHATLAGECEAAREAIRANRGGKK